MTKTLKIEEARKLLDELDPAMPDGFEVVAVARTPSPGQFVVKWRDPAEKEIYDDGVADMEGGDAANAYRFQPSYEYSYVWFNENPDGGGDVATCEIMSDEDVADAKKKGVEIVDAS